MKTSVVLGLSAVIVGGAIGFALGYGMKIDAGSDIVIETAPPKTVTRVDESETKRLRARIAELERRLAEAGKRGPEPAKAVAEAAGEASEAAPEPAKGPLGPDRFQDGLAKLAKENPARYAQITNRMAQFRQRRQERTSSRLGFLASVDVSGLSAGEKRTHHDIQDLIVRREELEEKMHDRSLSMEDRRSIMEEMRDTDRQLREVSESERDTLLTMLTDSLGYTGDDARSIAETAKAIFDATSEGSMMAPPPPPPAPGE